MSSPQVSASPPQQTAGRAWLTKHGLHAAVIVLAVLPVPITAVQFFTSTLSVNPISELTARTGMLALMTLVLSLACTPANMLFGWRRVLPLRRTLGLVAFFYTVLHMLTFTVLDYQLNPAWIIEAVAEQPYVTVGTAAFLLLLPLAITSTRGWMRRLGKNWKRLHRLSYVAAILALLQFAWLVKGDLGLPLLFAAIVAVLLILRIPAVQRQVATWRSRHTRRAVRDPGIKE
jgi:sulfoxide reductase heme-binding subunit YedZ